jgi:hypothetical protein
MRLENMSQQQSQEKFISSSEGASLLGVDRQSFFYYVSSRGVKRREIDGDGKERYEYSYEDILGIKESVQSRRATRKRGTKPQETNREPAMSKTKERSALTDWCKVEDLPYIYALDCQLYGIENSAPPTTTLKWIKANPLTIRMLFDAKNRKEIWGTLTLLPMREETIIKILQGKKSESELEELDILSYETGKEYTCYISSLAILPQKRHLLPVLFESTVNYWCNHPEINICKLYAFALGAYNHMDKEVDGLRMIKRLFFSPRYDIAENAWELDLNHYNPSPIIQHFQNCVREKRKEVKAQC